MYIDSNLFGLAVAVSDLGDVALAGRSMSRQERS
jgi:hypothetical protein